MPIRTAHIFRIAIIVAITLAATAAPRAADVAAPRLARNERAAVSPDGSRIAFVSDRDSTTDIYVIGVDGTNETRLTHTTDEEDRPMWAPDGGAIWFAVFANDSSRIHAIDPRGEHARVIATVPGRGAVPSPDGKRIVRWIGSWTRNQLFVSAIDGSTPVALTDGAGTAWNAAWSRDGARIAFTGSDSSGGLHVFVVKSDGAELRQLTHFAPEEGRAQMPAWSNDGRQLAVQVSQRQTNASHVWLVDAQTGAARKLAPHAEPVLDEVPAWFPDGKRIAFQSDRAGHGMQIWVMNADGSSPHPITKSYIAGDATVAPSER